jgi:hypothetical protein
VIEPKQLANPEHTWNRLSHYMRTTLDELDRGKAPRWRYHMIRQGLARKGLLVHAGKGAPLTERGRRLIRWARDTGRCPT